jgi:hypothetical protein
MEEKISRNNVEMMVISNDNPKVERVSTDDIKKIL